MPILIKDYEFQEDEEHLYLTISLNGKSPKNVDIYCNDSYLKVNINPFFFELDFLEKVDEDTSSANISQTDVKITIKKETPKLWGRASLFTDEEKSKPENKELIKKRRNEAFDRSLEKSKEKQKQKKIFFNNQKREMVKRQMDVEKAEKDKIKEIKNKAAEEAKKDLYSWIDNEKKGNPNFVNSRRRRYQDNDEGRIREINSDEEEEEEGEDSEIEEENVDIWSDHDSIVEYNEEEEPEEAVDPWGNDEPSNEINDFMKQDEKLDSLAKRRRQKDNKNNKDNDNTNNKDNKSDCHKNNDNEMNLSTNEIKEKSDTTKSNDNTNNSIHKDKDKLPETNVRDEEPEHEWERLTEVEKTEENDPKVTEEDEEGNNAVLQEPITEEIKENPVSVYKGKVIEDISVSDSEEDEDEFDMEAIKAKVQKEMEQRREKELKKLGNRYYKSAKTVERTLPPPRALNQKINITFTPRDRPTAARESEDEKYRNHMKRQRAIKASLDKLHDSKGVEEESAIFLKEKGNIFFKHEDYEGAINAYTSALELEPENIGCLSNRSICYLKLKKYEECLKDCDKGISTLRTIKDEFEHGACNAEPIRVPFTRAHELAMMKLLVRRGATYVANKKYQEALNDYNEALTFDHNNETILHDIEQIKKVLNV